MPTKRNERGRLIHVCPNCGEGAPLIHSCVNIADDKWTIVEVFDADGFTIYRNPSIEERDDLRAVCGICGKEAIAEYQEVAGQRERPELYLS